MWGSGDCNFIQKEKVGQSGGQLIIWDVNCFDVYDTFICEFFIGIRGTWRSTGKKFTIINVYGPHNDSDKLKMRDSLETVLLRGGDEAYVLCGDFNEVRNEDERFNCEFIASRARKFNDFISSNNLIDLPMGGRKFTRASEDGIKYSKLDRFLINGNFNLMWDNLSVSALDRSLSDHCPILLKKDEKNYGPKPVRVFDEWLKTGGIEDIIDNSWNEELARGLRKDCSFRNKLKRLKATLKDKCGSSYSQLDGDIEMHKHLALMLESKAESTILNDTEMDMWKEARKN
ncbi:uncharacterized protein [Rutidosis leptorrhynchoides]|uniref:uncharacterized protein n=1 Tax=Rutidosis leptorrhynchoides TaxID=125765 RepID=UPI003A9952CA